MAVEYLQSSSGASYHKGWFVVNSNRNGNENRERSASKTGAKLLFNEAVPACASNRASRVDPPAYIVIEKPLTVSEGHNRPESTKSSISFTAVSEERLNAAVKLAKMDLRRGLIDSPNRSPQNHSQKALLLETSDVELLQELAATPSKAKLKASCPKEQVPRGRSEHTNQNRPHSGQSPPARDHCLQENKSLDKEIHRLQHELEVCIQKAEELVNREQKMSEPLEPDEQNKLDLRKLKQAARSTSIIYALQQQVKELHENLQHGHKTKSKSLQRLAAAHRGVLRALHSFIQQLSDTTHGTDPPNFKDLGQLIHLLCLCSAKVELNKESAVPQSALSILQKLETLDSAISKQAMLKKMQVQACPKPVESHHSMSITASRGDNAFVQQAARKPPKAAKITKGKRKAWEKPKYVSNAMTHRRHVLTAGLERLVQQREQENNDVKPVKNTSQLRRRLYPEEVHPKNKVQIGSFVHPTVSSRLRVNQRPQRDQSVPWIPTSPHSPPRQRLLQSKTTREPRCLFPSEKSPQPSPKTEVTNEAQPSLNSDVNQQAQDEALRIAWLDKMTMKRLNELQQLSDEEKQRLHMLRLKVISPIQCPEGEQHKTTENVQSPSDQEKQFNLLRPSLNNRLLDHVAQRSAESAEQLSEALLEDSLEDTARLAWAVETDKHLKNNAQRWTQTSTLENMLLRMEEIQKDQEEVRRRVTSIIYSDPLNWEKSNNTVKDSGSRPCSPQPIRLTKPELRQSPAAEIILEKPLETGDLLGSRQTEPEVSEVRSVFPVAVQSSRGVVLSVPSHTLRSIRQSREDYEAFCRSVALKTTGGVTPWAVADSLAEELLAEALSEVAAEFQDVVEEYAEVVFTSEFLQPVHSPPAPSAQATKQQ